MSSDYIEPTNAQLANFLVVYGQHWHLSAPLLENLMILYPRLREEVLRHHRQFRDQINDLTEKMEAGELGCEYIRPNNKKCPNRNEPGSFYCGLHKENEES